MTSPPVISHISIFAYVTYNFMIDGEATEIETEPQPGLGSLEIRLGLKMHRICLINCSRFFLMSAAEKG